MEPIGRQGRTREGERNITPGRGSGWHRATQGLLPGNALPHAVLQNQRVVACAHKPMPPQLHYRRHGHQGTGIAAGNGLQLCAIGTDPVYPPTDVDGQLWVRVITS